MAVRSDKPERHQAAIAALVWFLMWFPTCLPSTFASPARADTVDYRSYLRMVGEITLDLEVYSFRDVAFTQHYAVLADSWGMFCVADVADPADVVIVHEEYVGTIGAMNVSGDRGYLARYDEVRILDLSDPALPLRIGTIPVPEVVDIALDGGLVYLLTGTPGLVIVDAANPGAPVIRGSVALPETPSALTVAGGFAYVACGAAGLRVVDVVPPQLPSIVGSAPSASYAQSVAVRGSILALADTEAGLRIFDITTPSQPVLLGSLDTSGQAGDVAISGDVALVTVWEEGMRLVDISDPASPELLGTFDAAASGAASDVALSASLAFVSLHTDGVAIVDFSSPDVPAPCASLPVLGATQVAVTGNLACVAAANHGLAVVDLTDPEAPILRGQTPLAVNAAAVAIRGDHAWVADFRGGLQAVDLSDPDAPAPGAVIDLPGYANDVAIEGDYAYVVGDDTGLQIVRVANPDLPYVVGSLALGVDAWAVSVDQGIVYLAEYSRLQIVDATVPAAPHLVYTSPFPCGDVVADDRLAFVINNSLLALNTSDPAHPVVLDTAPATSYGMFLARGGRFVYSIDGSSGAGFQAFDVADPSNIQLLGNLPLPEGVYGAYGLAAGNGHVVYPDLSALVVLPGQSEPTAVGPGPNPGPSLHLAGPNPTSGPMSFHLCLTSPAEARVLVTGVDGRVLRTLLRGRLAPGSHRLAWDGCDAAGRRMATGVYLVHAEGPWGNKTAKLTLIR